MYYRGAAAAIVVYDITKKVSNNFYQSKNLNAEIILNLEIFINSLFLNRILLTAPSLGSKSCREGEIPML